ncbi:MAG: MBL fold metallo-hydrolase [Candidatus Micrarchaeia archaeon]
MKLTLLGGAAEVGRSAVLIETENKRFLMDYGIKVEEFGPAELPLVPHRSVQEVVISHAHLDHIGFLPMVYEKSIVPWHATPPTQALAELLIQDAMKVNKLNGFENPYTVESFKRAMENFNPVEYEETIQMRCGPKLTLHDAGHILGAAICEFKIEGKKVVYTGDFNLSETRMHNGASFAEDIDILITESTYSAKEHPDRENEEKKLVKNVKWALDRGGSALVPVFGVGRAQEVLLILHESFPDTPIMLEGMAIKATDIYLRYPEYIKNPKGLHDAMHDAIIVKKPPQRRRATKGGAIVVSPAGMLNGGNALWYLDNLPENSSVTLTGYCAEGTNGWMLLNKGAILDQGKEKKLNYHVEQVDLSAHAGRKDLWDLIKRTSPELIVAMHGDNCFQFVDELELEGFSAIAPRIGETIPVKI